MRLLGSLQVLRRRWPVTAAGIVVGLVVGWVSAPGATTVATTFEATHILLIDPSVNDGSLVNRVALMATLGPVPGRVAARLHVDPRQVQSMVSAGTHDNEGEVLITGRSNDRAQAEALANVTAEELIVELGGPKAPLRTLEPAVAAPVRSDDIKGPTSRSGRSLLLGGFGLVLGIGAAFAVERLDNRIRTKPTAEEALGALVMAEVPAVPRGGRGLMISTEHPSPFIEAYRGLRTGVVRSVRAGDDGAGPRVIVVTSATGREGKTTTVAHLAATLAEVGHSVVAVSADLRRPQLQQYFDRPLEPGLSDLLRGAPDVRRLTDLNTTTGIRGVRFVASGAPVRNPGPLLDRVGEQLKEARELGDFVLVDSPPLLVASEAADIARHADAVLLVVRAGRTSIGAAARAVELLERLNVPLLGAVLVGGDGAGRRRYR
jgi:capsular exopolysaccharide synthesis family protein